MEHLLLKIEPLEIPPFFYNNFFRFRGDFPPFPPGYALARNTCQWFSHQGTKSLKFSWSFYFFWIYIWWFSCVADFYANNRSTLTCVYFFEWAVLMKRHLIHPRLFSFIFSWDMLDFNYSFVWVKPFLIQLNLVNCFFQHPRILVKILQHFIKIAIS